MSYSVSCNYDPIIKEASLESAEAHIATVKTSQELPPTTVLIVDSTGAIVSFYSSKRITGEYVKQQGGAGHKGESVYEVGRVDFDATEAILLLNCPDIIGLVDDDDARSDLAHLSGVNWDGPSEVEQDDFIESICEYFALDKIEDLTQELLEAAVQGMYGGIVEEKIDLVIQVSVRRFKETSANAFVEELDYDIVSKTPGAVVTSTEIIDA